MSPRTKSGGGGHGGEASGVSAANIAGISPRVTNSSLAGPPPRTATLGGGRSLWNVDPDLMRLRLNVAIPLDAVPVDSSSAARGRGTAQGGEPAEVNVVGAFLGGAGRGASNIYWGAVDTVMQSAAAAADLANAPAYAVSGHNLYYGNLSQVGNALASGQVTAAQVVKDIGLNFATAGGYAIGQTIGDYFNGDITTDQFSQQIGGPAALQLATLGLAKTPASNSARLAPRRTGVGAASALDETFAVNRRFSAADTALKHGTKARKGASAGPRRGQHALDNSVQVSANSPRRIGIDATSNEIVVFDRTGNLVQGGRVVGGSFHGHIRAWRDLTSAQRNTLIWSGISVSRSGRISLSPNVILNEARR